MTRYNVYLYSGGKLAERHVNLTWEVADHIMVRWVNSGHPVHTVDWEAIG